MARARCPPLLLVVEVVAGVVNGGARAAAKIYMMFCNLHWITSELL
jgi:hypothetical protein